MGHVMRCLAIADELRARGVEPTFVIGGESSAISDFVQARGHDAIPVSPSGGLPASTAATLAAARARDASFVLTDVCHEDALAAPAELDAYHAALASDYFTVCIAGSSLVDVPADVVVSPYYRTRYPDVGAAGRPLVLLGPSYFVFRREFAEMAPVPRAIRKTGSRVLVTIGGSDELQITAKVLRALLLLPPPSVECRVAIGPQFSPALRTETARLLGQMGGHGEILDSNASLAQAMMWADVAVTGDGLTKYETAVTGTPSITLSRPGGEQALSREFDTAGSVQYAGDVSRLSIEQLEKVIRELLQDDMRRGEMSRVGKELVDGKGLDRILERIPGVPTR